MTHTDKKIEEAYQVALKLGLESADDNQKSIFKLV